MTRQWNYNKLRGRIKEVCGTQEEFANRLGIGYVSLSKRLNNQLDFTQAEIFRARDILSIPDGELDEYFFCERSLEN